MARIKEKSKAPASFDEFLSRTFGDEIIVPASTLIERPRLIIPTVLSLDIALSGGIPEGRIVLLTGKPKAGKTTICLEILANAIQLDRPAYYADVERRCTPSLLESIHGLDKNRLEVIQAKSGKLQTAEEWFHLLERICKDKPGCVVVVDSVAMLCTLAEMSEATGESHDMTGVPKLLAVFFRKIKDIVDNNNCTLIFISQYQTNRDPASRKKWDEKGGVAIQYACSVWLNVDWFRPWEKDENQEVFGQDTFFTIRASALGKPFRPCAVPIRFGKGVDHIQDVMNHAENLGLIEKAGAWYSIPMLVAGDVVAKFQGCENLRAFLQENPDHLARMERAIREMVIPNSVQHADQAAQGRNRQAQSEQVPAAE